ncbi:probable DNA-3-methyladenine glycosylase 2 [Phalaenopsis equestris]|uniref:probable DNA-3-methyladenine glycosylase 2 n=1 Tax=Phalaenopsis equestris TaxID=78828 RepID=UPI0009E5B1F1|nr:probable DNA-3-methyladenine glycosylase 2 [Phalaenopsis equestris]XP_020587830.1 probable DNA-3-methyladenine glycosylase 2 [Phalaenopsis equestris]
MTDSIRPLPPPPMPDPNLSSPSPSSSVSSISAVTNHISAVDGEKSLSRPKKLRKLSPDSTTPPPPPSFFLLPRPLSAPGELDSAIRHLRAADPHLAAVIDELEPLSLNQFQHPFLTLARSIIHQQLAPKAAVPTYERFLKLCEAHGGVSPSAVLALSSDHLRQIGISARKSSYLHDLARKFHTGVLSDAAIVSLDDRSLLALLTMVEGIGTWSAHMFMIFSLHRPDVLPVGDATVRRGVQVLYGLAETPRPSQMEQLCERWRPYRSVGSWYMWRLSQAKAAVSPSVVGLIAATPHQPLMMDSFQVDR